MSDATCTTCPWCREMDTYHGECRFHAPVIHEGPRWPSVDPETDWCGEHPDRQPHLESATTTLVGRETFPTESDMHRIVDALEKMASTARRWMA